jgi:hypothetical protein
MTTSEEEKAAKEREAAEREAAERKAADAEAARKAQADADEARRKATKSTSAAGEPAPEPVTIGGIAVPRVEATRTAGYTGGPADDTGGVLAPTKDETGQWVVTDPNDGRRYPVSERQFGTTFQALSGYLIAVGEPKKR